jgi:hypothetical protein
MHSFLHKTILKNIKTTYTSGIERSMHIFLKKCLQKFLHRCLSCKKHVYIIRWCVPW